MNAGQLLVVSAIRVYRYLLSPAKSALLGPLARCRFTPSCSGYALEAVLTHGVWRGLWLSVRRLSRCHPWGGCGWDPVPPVAGSPRLLEKGRSQCPHPAVVAELSSVSQFQDAAISPGDLALPSASGSEALTGGDAGVLGHCA